MKTRFAPSPTGLIHLGNARTALFNVLLARRHHGVFLLRIEDTDMERSQKIYVDYLIRDLQWLGLSWQEGPYFQSDRSEIYDQYYRQLEQEGHAFPCFCSEESLELARKLQRARGQPPRYPGTCRHLTQEQVAEKIASGLKPALRFHMPEGKKIVFEDQLKGRQEIQNDDIGDFIIRRSDGSASFMFSNAIDDALMKVDVVMRGEDHLTNTPRQLAILEALKLPQPEYAHLPLIFGADGAPLSKRNGSRSLEELRKEGFLPLAVFNYLARLGHHYEAAHLMTVEQLEAHFSLEHVSSSPARFDEAQLRHWQKEAIAQLSPEAAADWLSEALRLVPETLQKRFTSLVLPTILFPCEARVWAEIFYQDFVVPESNHTWLRDAGKAFFQQAGNIFKAGTTEPQAFFKALQTATAQKGKALFMPVRVALTGALHGPDMADLFELLGPEKILQRLAHAENL